MAIKNWAGTSGAWETDANWVPLGVPAFGDDAFLATGFATLSTTITVNSIGISGATLDIMQRIESGEVDDTVAQVPVDISPDQSGKVPTLRATLSAGPEEQSTFHAALATESIVPPPQPKKGWRRGLFVAFAALAAAGLAAALYVTRFRQSEPVAMTSAPLVAAPAQPVAATASVVTPSAAPASTPSVAPAASSATPPLATPPSAAPPPVVARPSRTPPKSSKKPKEGDKPAAAPPPPPPADPLSDQR